eukprot:CAMPEP_0177637744 /NCGR_PEP_ID=MMETSP0447-20121125/5129_1 /TAXON_ID=0 /ORGANISM="Stygamoeba regulata, Strain BSH-02190019" /LENGTH=352 /DNA_ID=CAMNT_0019139681 /DNA_START=269 /DNA_END=1327 /DNA_ORIENTATION=+
MNAKGLGSHCTYYHKLHPDTTVCLTFWDIEGTTDANGAELAALAFGGPDILILFVRSDKNPSADDQVAAFKVHHKEDQFKVVVKTRVHYQAPPDPNGEMPALKKNGWGHRLKGERSIPCDYYTKLDLGTVTPQSSSRKHRKGQFKYHIINFKACCKTLARIGAKYGEWCDANKGIRGLGLGLSLPTLRTAALMHFPADTHPHIMQIMQQLEEAMVDLADCCALEAAGVPIGLANFLAARCCGPAAPPASITGKAPVCQTISSRVVSSPQPSSDGNLTDDGDDVHDVAPDSSVEEDHEGELDDEGPDTGLVEALDKAVEGIKPCKISPNKTPKKKLTPDEFKALVESMTRPKV